MIFRDGIRKAGFFENNVYISALITMAQFDDYMKDIKKKIPESFKQEIKEYLGQVGARGEKDNDDQQYIGQEFGQIEKEDLMATN